MKTKQFNRLKLAAESGAIPFVVREAEKLARVVPDFTSFEQECYQAIGRTLENLSDNGREKKALIQRLIQETRHRFLKKLIKREMSSLEGLSEGETPWEPRDVLADVEGEVLLKEKIALLAQDDPRKKTILEIWNRGCTNDSEISSLLAERFGGNPESHRKFIQRFRVHCQDQLTA
ncbi:hypothetical protein [Bacillus haynesii]|nr:hypothetical protein [Bacillus haynesii]MCY9372664.1 mediator of RNA polymerase II transcription subunit 14 [Bacillus haynesii]